MRGTRGKQNRIDEETKIQPDRPSDFYLDLLLGFVENGAEIPLTLNVRGLIVSGVMISAKTYFESFAGGAVKERIEGLREEGKLPFLDEVTEEDDAEEVHKYIHLKNSRFFGVGPQGVIPGGDDGIFWRGRISSIDGYSESQFGFAEK